MYEHLQAYLSKDIYPFHMPGHKRNPMFLPTELAGLDLTEIPGMDVLRKPTGVIRSLQDAIAKFYGSDESYVLVNGSSAGVIAAICAVSSEGDRIYAARNGHVSMFNGMALAGAIPVYIMPELAPDGLAGGIIPETLDNMQDGAVVFLVSPTYEGFVSDIRAIAEKVHNHNGILIVDEAHGAHFRFHDAFPDSALDLGADIVVQSFHKTLPVLGQIAVLHVKSPRVDVPRLRFFLQAMQTTSPSYMLMGQLDYALNMLWKRPELFDMYVNRLDALRKALTTDNSQLIRLTGQERIGQHGIYDIDRSKLLFCLDTTCNNGRTLGLSPHFDDSATSLSEILAAEYRIQLEMAAGRHLLAMTSVADTDEGIQRLWAAIGSMNIKYEAKAENPCYTRGSIARTLDGTDTYHAPLPAQNHRISFVDSLSVLNRFIPKLTLPPSQSIRQETETVPWEQAAGRIAGEIITTYPPGIALVTPGELIPYDLPKLAPTIQVIKHI